MSGKHIFSGRQKDLLDTGSYLAARNRDIALLVLSAALLVVFTFYSLSFNDNHMDIAKIVGAIGDHINGTVGTDKRSILEDRLVFRYFLPRAIACVTIGAMLAMGGAVMQTIIRNPLADPYTTGISSGALLGVSLFVILGIDLGIGLQSGMVVMAFLFSMLPCAVLIFFTMFKKVTPGVVILIGIAVSYVFSACTTLINYTANPSDYQTIYKWTLGSLSNVDADTAPLLIVAVLMMMVSMLWLSKLIDISSIDDKLASSLGVNSARTRVICLILISLFTALSVSFVGTIGFVGLIVPNIARKLVASSSKLLIPMSAIAGGAFLLICDIIARSVLLGGIPVGIVTAFIGGPVMIYVLIRMKKNAWSNRRSQTALGKDPDHPASGRRIIPRPYPGDPPGDVLQPGFREDDVHLLHGVLHSEILSDVIARLGRGHPAAPDMHRRLPDLLLRKPGPPAARIGRHDVVQTGFVPDALPIVAGLFGDPDNPDSLGEGIPLISQMDEPQPRKSLLHRRGLLPLPEGIHADLDGTDGDRHVYRLVLGVHPEHPRRRTPRDRPPPRCTDR